MPLLLEQLFYTGVLGKPAATNAVEKGFAAYQEEAMCREFMFLPLDEHWLSIRNV